jgi:asparagine synthase (glutamine-hydrolysing)
VDSALVTAFAREVRPDIEAFTVRMPAASHDESAAAAETARHFRVRHHILDCDPNAGADLVQAIEQLGLPFADSSLLPSIWLCRAASKHVKVALGGDGGDDLFLGYQRQMAAPKLAALGADPSLAAVARWMRTPSLLGSERASKPIRFLDAVAHGGYKDLIAIFPDSFFAQLLQSPAHPHAVTHFGHVPHPCSDPDAADVLHRRFDAMFYLPFDLLRKADTASMSAPLELRCPFLDSKLAFAALGATRESLLLNGQRKGLLRALARKYLPASIVDRPKMGFAIPLADWFRSDFGSLRTLLGDLVINAKDPFPADILGCELNRTFIRELFDQHMSGKRDHAQRLYALLVMAIWCRWYRRITRGEAARPAQPSRP